MSGHITDSVFSRYDIKSNVDLLNAADLLDAAAGAQKKTEKKTARVHAFRRRA